MMYLGTTSYNMAYTAPLIQGYAQIPLRKPRHPMPVTQNTTLRKPHRGPQNAKKPPETQTPSSKQYSNSDGAYMNHHYNETTPQDTNQ